MRTAQKIASILRREACAMPETTFMYPDEVILLPSTKSHVIDIVRASVAQRMNGTSYRGESLELTAQHVDIILRAYDPKDVNLSSLFLVRITGYDYPERMNSILDRLTGIAADIECLVTAQIKVATPPEAWQKLVSVTFLPYQSGCWASSAS